MCDVFVGRVGVPAAEVRVARIGLAGPELRIEGRIKGDPDAVGHLAEQLRGLVDSPDEQFVPVRWVRCPLVDRHAPGLTRLDGYYTVEDAQVSFDRLDFAPISITVRRVRGHSAPLFELRTLGALRAGSSGTVHYWHALPDATTGYEQGSVTPTMSSRACEPPHPEIQSRALTVYRHAQLADSRVDFYTPPSDWYLGAPSLSVDGHLVVGRQVRQSHDWLLSNGVVRLYGVEGSGAVGMDRWDGLAWVTVGEWHAGKPEGEGLGRTFLPLSAPHALTVLHNSAELVAIRLSSDAASMYPGSRFVVNLDLSLRRGAPYVEATLSTRGAYKWGYLSPIRSAEQTVSGNVLSTGGTQRAVGSRSDTASVVGLDGRAWVSELELMERQQWLWGCLPASESAATVYAQYLSAMAERVSVVAR